MTLLEIFDYFAAALSLGLIIQFIILIDVWRLEEKNRDLLSNQSHRKSDPSHTSQSQ
jgi:hypothetical protein